MTTTWVAVPSGVSRCASAFVHVGSHWRGSSEAFCSTGRAAHSDTRPKMSTQPLRDAWKRRLRPFRAAWACLAVLSIAAAAAELALNGSVTAEHRPTPELHWVAPALEAVLPTAWFVAVLWRARRDEASAWARVAPISIAIHLTLVFLAFGITLALILGIGGLDLFGPSWIEESSARTPDRVGYVYTKGLFCGYQLFERRTWTLTLHHVDTVSTTNCSRERPPKLTWNGATRRFDLVLTNPDERLGEEPFGFTFH